VLKVLIEIAGWAGMVLILGAYFLVTIGRLSGRSRTYQWLNVVGSCGFLINSGWYHALPSAALNLVWMGIGAYALIAGPPVRSS